MESIYHGTHFERKQEKADDENHFVFYNVFRVTSLFPPTLPLCRLLKTPLCVGAGVFNQGLVRYGKDVSNKDMGKCIGRFLELHHNEQFPKTVGIDRFKSEHSLSSARDKKAINTISCFVFFYCQREKKQITHVSG